MGWMYQDRCVEGALGRQIRTLADMVLLLESSQTPVTVGWLHWNENPPPGQVPGPPLTAHLPTPLPEVPGKTSAEDKTTLHS